MLQTRWYCNKPSASAELRETALFQFLLAGNAILSGRHDVQPLLVDQGVAVVTAAKGPLLDPLDTSYDRIQPRSLTCVSLSQTLTIGTRHPFVSLPCTSKVQFFDSFLRLSCRSEKMLPFLLQFAAVMSKRFCARRRNRTEGGRRYSSLPL